MSIIETICSEEISCSICLDDYVDKDNIAVTECGHTFHSNCFNDWLKESPSCPLCRTEIKINISETEEQLEDGKFKRIYKKLKRNIKSKFTRFGRFIIRNRYKIYFYTTVICIFIVLIL